jgi:adenylate cyclase
MAQEIIPPGAETDNPVGEPRQGWSEADARWRLRLPVGVALGLVFSITLIVITGLVITYMSASGQRITGRLLSDGAVANISASRAVFDRFFSEQELVLSAISLGSADRNGSLTNADLRAYHSLLPESARLELVQGSQAKLLKDAGPEWSGFEYDEAQGEAVLTSQFVLENGQVARAVYPRRVFDSLVASTKRGDTQTPFLLASRNTVVAVSGLDEKAFAASAPAPLPILVGLTETPLHRLWEDQPEAQDIPGTVDGRLFRSTDAMHVAIFDEVDGGPFKGWIIGVLFKARDYGAAFDQTRIVFYVAAAALLIGAVLSFFLGRLLGRPLTRLAETSMRIRNLDFNGVERLPPSRLAELDDVNSAFNGTLGALNAFARYVPRQLVQRLIAEGMTDPRQIETRDMTIVFTDLAGFTSLASHLSAEETAAFLNRYFETVSDAIAAEGGTIDKYIGDGVMAFWGAPVEQPDHAAHAVASMKALAEQLTSAADTQMRLRIGIHSGKVVVGNLGSANRMNYTVVGDAVNVAARLQEYGKTVDPDAKVIVLASGDTISRLPERVDTNSIGSISLRGREEKTDVFRIA